MKFLCSWLLIACSIGSAGPAHAATVLGVIGERAAPEVSTAAREVLASVPQRSRTDRIVLRTTQQLAEMDTLALERLLSRSDRVVAAAVFGVPAERLRTTLNALRAKGRAPAAFYALHADIELSRASYGERGSLAVFSGAELNAIGGDPAPPPALLARLQSDRFAREWAGFRSLWREGGDRNLRHALGWLLDGGELAAPQAQPDIVWRQRHATVTRIASDGRPLLVVLDLQHADVTTGDAICDAADARGMACVNVLARWGAASREAVRQLREREDVRSLAGLVVLQDFVVGAAEGREATTEAFALLDVPVFKAIRLNDRSAAQWRLAAEGLPSASVQYRVAMPELQGTGQAAVVATAGAPRTDPVTGVRLSRPEPHHEEVRHLVERAFRWHALRAKPVADRRVAVIYYNHPPGRQNIGADNLDVPASLHHVLHAMQRAGYRTGELPGTPQALLDRMMAEGVNMPEDNAELAALASRGNTLSVPEVRRWLSTLPPQVQHELRDGPLGRLELELAEAWTANERPLGLAHWHDAAREMRHLVEGLDHPRRADGLNLLDRAAQAYARCFAPAGTAGACAQGRAALKALRGLALAGLKGWGTPPGAVMVHGDRVVLPGIMFGNVFIGPQPPRGWEVDEELLHANTRIPPPYQYLAFYHWVRDVFRADVIVHVGRHSTYEFLPGKAVGLSAQDYPRLVAGDVPGVYPYIVDGVGEGTQAKRRGLAVIVDHLTPPLAATPLYDRLLVLRQLVESFESSSSEPLKREAAAKMRKEVEGLQLKAELEASMADVLAVRGIGFEQADDELLAHEIGHYLTKLQEKFMPHGLHVFGRAWSDDAMATMLASMREAGHGERVRALLAQSPAAELSGLLHGMEGGYVRPGKGNDPLRAPESLPTGRNFHGLDGDALPTPLGFKLGAAQAARVLARKAKAQGSDGVVLWASDAVRDEGVMIGFSLELMGITPRWNARGIVQGLALQDLSPGRERRDVIVTTSGLFRDLYPNLVQLVDRAGRMALAASAQTLVASNPDCAAALDAALAPLGDVAVRSHEPLESNALARQWLSRWRSLQREGMNDAEAGRQAAWRVFGDAPGAYGAGVNRLTERSGAWRERSEIARAYLHRMGHAYGLDAQGLAAHRALDKALSGVERSYHGRASHLYGLLDNNDAFDYFGGLSLAVETLAGRVPDAQVLYHADAAHADVEPLQAALLRELRGRYLNPAWIKPLMGHGYAGARTFGQEFLENLWGWQVTRPDIVRDWAWDEVQHVYFDDAHGLGIDKFLSTAHSQHVKAHMLALMLVAAHKGFWHTDEANVKKLGTALADLVSRNGLPGSGHTAPQHPMWDWLARRLDPDSRRQLQAAVERARGKATAAAPQALVPREQQNSAPTPKPSEIQAKPPARPDATRPAPRVSELQEVKPALIAEHPVPAILAAMLALVLLIFGMRRGMAAIGNPQMKGDQTT